MSLLVNIQKTLGRFTLDVAFESEGGVLGLLGPSGCGKSMTLKCIAGVETPDSGKIVLDGVTLFDSQRRINLPPQQRQVGFLFQNYALFPNMTVRQNILCGLCREKDRPARERACQEAISLLQLEGLERHKPRQLSGGQQQRVALARILVGQPKLLLLDEPFSALDSHLRLHLQMEMKRLLGEFGRDVLLVTHSRDEAYHLAQRIAVLENGRLCTMKETKALFADPESRASAALTGCKNIYAARRCGPHLVEVPELGLRLTTPKEVRNDLTAIGIRAHDFSPEERENQFPICLDSEMEEPFERIVRFRYPNQSPDSEPVWWRFSKEIQPASMPEALGVAGDALLLLYDESF